MKKKCLQYQQAKCFLINEKCFIHIKTTHLDILSVLDEMEV